MQGLDVVWETVGGQTFDTCAQHLATGGRLLVIGLMSVYAAGWPQSKVNLVCASSLSAVQQLWVSQGPCE